MNEIWLICTCVIVSTFIGGLIAIVYFALNADKEARRIEKRIDEILRGDNNEQ